MFNCNLCSDWRQVGGDIELLDAAGRPAAQPRIGRIVDAALRRHLRRHLGRIAPASGTRTADRRQTRTGQLQAILSRPRSRFLFPPSSLPPHLAGVGGIESVRQRCRSQLPSNLLDSVTAGLTRMWRPPLPQSMPVDGG